MVDASILFVANNPGGYRALEPVLHQWPTARVALTSPLTTLSTLPTERYEIIDGELPAAAVAAYLRQHGPRAVITGTSVVHNAGGDLENRFRQAAHQLQIPSIGVLDHWCNYAARFTSRDGLALDALPDCICVMDARARDEMQAEGIPRDRIRVTGHPGFDRLMQCTPLERAAARQRFRQRRHLAPTQWAIGFIGEPVAADYGRQRGYTEHDVAALLSATWPTNNDRPALIVRPHPRQSRHDLAGTLSGLPLDWSDPHVEPSLEFVLGCDLLLGMTSILLLEAAILQRPAISVQPGLSAAHPAAQLVRPLPMVSDAASLQMWLNPTDWTISGTHDAFHYAETHATERVIAVIRDYLS